MVSEACSSQPTGTPPSSGYQVVLTLLVADPSLSSVDWNIEEATDS